LQIEVRDFTKQAGVRAGNALEIASACVDGFDGELADVDGHNGFALFGVAAMSGMSAGLVADLICPAIRSAFFAHVTP